MLFDSLAFVVAFPLFSAIFLTVPGRVQPILLLLGSLAACAAFGWVSLAWLVLITLLGFAFGRALEHSPSNRRLAVALLAVVAPLLAMKYTNFAIASLRSALAWVGFELKAPHFHASLPVGISFYTFMVLGYLIDIHIGRMRPELKISRFALFTAFYPKLVAGPVERAGAFLTQIAPPKRFDYDRVTDGLRIIGSGMLKKLVVADRLSIVVDGIYANPTAYGGAALVLTSVCYMFQLYYDFCGYSEIAVGSARILGYELVWNFNRPYAARSIRDYWRRWHISLTTWFFEYIFAPVSAALRGWKSGSVIVAMMTTFLVSGLWHGAQWTFVLYGLVHGVAMCLDYWSVKPRQRLKRFIPSRLYALLAWAITFTFIGCVDVLFRADSIADAGAYLYREAVGLPPDLAFLVQQHFSVSSLKALIAGLPVLKTDLVIAMGAVVCVELTSLLAKRRPFREQLAAQPIWIRWPIYYLVVTAILYLGSQNAATVFIYMQF